MLALNSNSQISGRCLLCRTDPRVKSVSVLLAVITIIALPAENYLKFIPISFWLLVMIILGHKSSYYYAKRLIQVYPMILFITIMLPFSKSYAGQETQILYSLGTLNIYRSGIMTFIDLNIRSVLIFMSSLILISETSLRSFLRMLAVLRIPKWIEAVIIYMQRFLHLITLEFNRIHLALTARAFNMNLWAKMKTAAKISGVYLGRLIDRSERSHIAMISRGFSGEIYTRFRLDWQKSDTFILSVNTVYFITILSIWTV
jgi:cobalt/nickel transport system permease protein